MFSIIFTVGAVNLAMGYALAVFVRRAMDDVDPPEEISATLSSFPPPPAANPEDDSAGENLLVEIEAVEPIPAQWVARLAAESIQAQSFVEATAHVMRLEVGKYREALVRLEDEFRRVGMTPTKLRSVVDRLVKLNRHWLKAQGQASEFLAERVDTLAEFADIGARLDKILRQQQTQIESTCNQLADSSFEGDVAGEFESVVGEFCQLANLAHQLRDDVSEALLATLRADDRLDDLEKSIRHDAATGLLSRAGMEVAVANWWQADPARHRLASAAVLDLVGVAELNRKQGARVGDRLIGAVGSLLDELLRKDRGFDVAARIDGQRFVLFFGDTGPRNATSAAERFRQSIAAATFERDGEVLEATVSCAVTEVREENDFPSLLARLEASLQAAKAAGGNCTMLDEGAGPQAVAPPAYQVPLRVVQIERE